MRTVIAFSAGFSLFVIAPIAYMVADTTPPYEYDYDRSYLVPKEMTVGQPQVMMVHWQFKKVNRTCPGSVTRIITDQSGSRISYDPAPTAVAVDVSNQYLERIFYLPGNISPGKHWYKSVVRYACNPLQRIWPLVVETEAIPFNVVAKPDQNPDK